MNNFQWVIERPPDSFSAPLAAFALHNGHTIRSELTPFLAIDEDHRLREEDPFTGDLAEIAETHVIVNVSRFEVDLNRPREKAVYRKPEDAWGLKVWKTDLPSQIIARSLEIHDKFYTDAYQLLKSLEDKFGRFIVLDLHSYCHQRNGPDAPFDSPQANPDINLGTATMNRNLWAKVIDRFISDLSQKEVSRKPLDVRENIRFKGGYFPFWVHKTFPQTGCCLSIEIKKTFMNEWSGQLDKAAFNDIKKALRAAVPGLMETLKQPPSYIS